jgi:hypothetical protein
MSLIICPECKKEISSFAKTCPNCGYPIQHYLNKEVNESSNDDSNNEPKEDIVKENNYKNPIPTTWIEDYKSRVTIVKIIFSIIFFMCFIGFIISFSMFSQYKIYDDVNPYLVSTILTGTFSMFLLMLMIGSFLRIKIVVRELDGYTVLVYFGISKIILVVENEEQDFGIETRYHAVELSGELPNGKKVTAKCSGRTAKVTID